MKTTFSSIIIYVDYKTLIPDWQKRWGNKGKYSTKNIKNLLNKLGVLDTNKNN